ncbi:dicarboxylate/amino acid:cation symporter [soil metagenome]
MNKATRTFVGLLAGLAAGAAINATGAAWGVTLAKALSPLGALWLAALKMTLVPLVFTLIASGVGVWFQARGAGRTMLTALGLFVGLLAFGSLAGAGLMVGLLKLWPMAPGALVAGAGAVEAPPVLPSIADQIVGLIPTNPVAAAAQGQMTPLVVFALLFGLALSRVTPVRRESVATMLAGVADALMVLIDVILLLAPVGVFVLALNLAANTGLGAAGALLQATLMLCAVLIVGIAFAYPLAWLGGGVGPLRFGRAALGPQAMAAGTTSSMATLPALIEAAESKLGFPPAIAGALLPLTVSTFRFGNVMLISATCVVAAVGAGAHPTLAQGLTACFVVVLTNIGVPGLPAAAVLYAAEAPGFEAIGAPLSLLPLFIAASTLPDILDTVCNVTADLSVATVVRRFSPAEEPSAT